MCFRRNLEAQQLFDRQCVAKIVGQGTKVIDAVGERHNLLVKLGLAGLLNPGVQVADVRHDAHDGLAIDLKYHAQHPVGRGVLRPHVQDHRSVLIGLDDWRGGEVGHQR